MKKIILLTMISVIVVLSACSSPVDETSTSLTEHAVISSYETKEKKTETDGTLANNSGTSNSQEEKSSDNTFHHELRAEYKAWTDESAELPGEEQRSFPNETVGSDWDFFAVSPEKQEPHVQGTITSQPTETQKQEPVPEIQIQQQSTECRHEKIYVSGAYPASCISEGFSGDIFCAFCGALIEPGYTTGYAEHSWVSAIVHTDAYLTCYCGLVFYSAEDHDRHVNEMVKAGDLAGEHGAVWIQGSDRTIYTCSVCGAMLNN